jgi:hypothetical protein
MTFGAIMTWIFSRVRPALWLDGVVARFAERYCTIERLAQLRAINLKRMLDRTIIQLEAITHPLQAAPSSSTAPSAVVVIVITNSALRMAPPPARPIRAPLRPIPNFVNSNSLMHLSIGDRRERLLASMFAFLAGSSAYRSSIPARGFQLLEKGKQLRRRPRQPGEKKHARVSDTLLVVR